jgi:hypothetical protein
MSNFLLPVDYVRKIQQKNFNVLLTDLNNVGVDLEAVENEVEIEIAAFLTSRFVVSSIIIKIIVWDLSKSFVVNDYTYLSATAWDSTKTDYKVDDLVSLSGKVYKALVANSTNDPSITPADWEEIGNNEQFYICIVDASAGTNPNVTGNFTAISDPRDQLMVRYAVNLTLYQLYFRSNPRSIPELRVLAHDDTMKSLKMAANPRGNFTPESWALIQYADEDNIGNDIDFGSDPVKESTGY